ncbi:unnamed protein product [Effrenium voratum]|nr:unnamed protein product [Effrenium voratum]
MRCLRLLLLSWSCRATTFKANYFHSTLTAIPSDLPYQTVSSTATPSTLDFSSSDFASQPSTGFAAQFATTLSITTAGYYSFQMDFRDGARLKFSSINVDDPPVLELDGVISGSDANVRTSAPRYYASGAHQLYVEYFSTGSNARLSLKYKGPDTSSAWELVCGTSSRCGTLDPLRAPQITLFGDIPSYFLKNISTAALYEDLGHQCVGSGSNWDVVLEAPSMAVPGIFTVNYTCQDSYGLIDTATREVRIRDWQSMALIGPNPFKMLRGDAFADPEVCCLDFEGTALTWVKFGTVDPDTAGIYEMSYTCVDPLINTMVTIKREVWVNTPPSMFLLGDASVKITKGTGYEDAGVVCQDSEDGLISPLLPNNEEIIVPARIYTSAALAFATNRAAADGGASTACGNCQEVATGHVRWVMLDLGAARSVTEVRVNTPEAGFRVHVALLPWPIQGTENATLYASTTGTCSSVAKQEIWDLELCQRAAEHLTLSVTSAAAFSSATGSAHACVYDSSDKSLKIQLGDARGTYGAGLSGKSATAEATLSGTQTRICGPLAPYTRIQAGFCEDVGYQPIRTAVRCGMAARSLGLTMNAHSSTASAVAPGGCYLYSSDWSIRLNQAQGSKEYVSSTALSSLCQLPGSCIDFYTSYPDGSMVSGTSSATKDTWGDCMATCASNSGCGVWSYDSSSQACKLFVPGAVGSASTDANLLSGPPFCQEVPGVSCHEEFSASTGAPAKVRIGSFIVAGGLRLLVQSPDDFPCVPTPGNLPSEACKSPQAAEMSEDCLFLDIYRPSGGSWPKAVMVWIHGGGMTLGDSGGGVGNGTSLSGQDVIVVSINYRLGPLGFLPLRPFGAATGTGGMNGLHDQIQALRWIQRYIGAFGGDAKRVTLFGCSAGSLSICTLAVSPLAKGLFHQAVLQSGPCLGPWGPGTVEEGEEVGRQKRKARRKSDPFRRVWFWMVEIPIHVL